LAADAWLRDLALGGRPQPRGPFYRRGGALPGAAPPRAAEARLERMGNVREQPQGEVLRAHRRGPRAAPHRTRHLADVRRGGDARTEPRMKFRLPWRSRAKIEADLDDELRFHLEMRTADLERSGLSAADARAQATREFGDMEFTRKYCRKEDTGA